jgi:hypothetical protein
MFDNLAKLRDALMILKSEGAVYIGTQEDPINHQNLALFNDPQTNTTLAIKFCELTPMNVRYKIEQSRQAFKGIHE